jgi:lysophospholipase L1-like esterase
MAENWIGTWAASPMNVWPGDAVLYGFHDQTVRQILRISKGGGRFRVRFSNEYGTRDIPIGTATIARADAGGKILQDTCRPLTFGGRSGATLLAGAPLLSDPVDFESPDRGQVAISAYFPGFAPVETYHYEAQQTAYISEFGNFADAADFPIQQTSTSRYFLSALLVGCEPGCKSIVCFGDSITDGYGSTVDADARWPDRLVERLAESGGLKRLSVLNHGIGGNRLRSSRARGASALARFDRDVVSLPNVGYLVVLEGTNDIGWPGTILTGEEAASLEQLIETYEQLIARAHLAGMKIFLGTLAPFARAFAGEALRGFHTPAKEALRQAVNAWIRQCGTADAVIDFDRALADDRDPSRLREDFDCGDHLHPSDAGYRQMTKAVDITLFGESAS